jgi:hypothetical protein
MSDSKGSVWVIVIGAALVAFAAYSLSDTGDEDDAVDAVVVGEEPVVADSTAMDGPVSQGGGAVQRSPKQIRMNADIQAAKTEAMESMQKMVEKATESMESGKNPVPNAMGGMMGNGEEAMPK